MAVETQAHSNPTEADDWDPSRLEQAIAHLSQAHAQLRSLRTTPPKMLQPLTKPSGGPTDIFHNFSQGVKDAMNQINEFSTLMRSEITTEVLDRAEASRLKKNENLKPWLVTEDEDWSSEKNQDDKTKSGEGKEQQAVENEKTDQDSWSGMSDEEEILARFRELYPSFRALMDPMRRTITV
ncbi:MAG: hypothetical protein M1816_000956 [Peltula sp. TS41687]|nr:MAG: hypothetical protein M1816_000956 [Peltula sp. TS41687]